ncbi:F-box protein, partial [Trifolium pratense]
VNKLKPPSDDIPIFHNLTHLKLHNNWDLVLQVLHHCPKLQNLQLYQGLYEAMLNEEDDQENWVEPKLVPQCLSSYLRTYLSLRKRLSLGGYLKGERQAFDDFTLMHDLALIRNTILALDFSLSISFAGEKKWWKICLCILTLYIMAIL